MVNRQYERIEVVINPAAGRNAPVLNLLNDALNRAELDWHISITQPRHSAEQIVMDALERGVDMVMVYGGDGTLNQAARPLINTQIPLCILPGGTANALAVQLQIPRRLRAAMRLALSPTPNVQQIDTGLTTGIDGGTTFLLNAGAGIYGDLVGIANRDLKDRYGWLAYMISTVQSVIKQPDPVRYRVTIDDRVIEQNALICLVANVSSLGVLGLSLSKSASVQDGLLDVFLLDASMQTILGSIGSFSGMEILAQSMHHWQGREVTIESDPPGQDVFVDGEPMPLHRTPATVRIMPGSLNVILPNRLTMRERRQQRQIQRRTRRQRPGKQKQRP